MLIYHYKQSMNGCFLTALFCFSLDVNKTNSLLLRNQKAKTSPYKKLHHINKYTVCSSMCILRHGLCGMSAAVVTPITAVNFRHNPLIIVLKSLVAHLFWKGDPLGLKLQHICKIQEMFITQAFNALIHLIKQIRWTIRVPAAYTHTHTLTIAYRSQIITVWDAYTGQSSLPYLTTC